MINVGSVTSSAHNDNLNKCQVAVDVHEPDSQGPREKYTRSRNDDGVLFNPEM